MRKIVSMLVISAVMLVTLVSCSNNSSVHEIHLVAEDEPYYTATEIVLGDEYLNDDNYSRANVKPVYYSDQNIFLIVKFDNNVFLERYDYKGNRLEQIDIRSLSGRQDYTLDLEMIGDGKNSYVIVTASDLNNEHKSNTLYRYNDDGLLKIGNIDLGSISDLASIKGGQIVNDDLFIYYDYYKNSMLCSGIGIINTNGECLYNTDIEGAVFSCNGNGNGDVILSVAGESEDLSFSLFNVSERRLETVSLDSNASDKYNLGSIGPDGKVYVQCGTKILRYDLFNKSSQEYIDCNYCNADLYSLSNGFIDHIDDKRLILLDLSNWRTETIGRCKITIVERAEQNPYSGRRVLDIAEIWSPGIVLSQGVKKLNEENTEYFAYVSDRYDVNVVEIPQMYSGATSGNDLMTMQSYITDQLMNDIRNGEGPDIVIGLGDVTQVNSDVYLCDLNEYIDGKNGIKRENYFDNALKAFSTEGKQYQFPLSIQIRGIMTNSANSPANGVGYTYDEYIELVNSVCNGKEPISSKGNSRYDVFNCLFAAMQQEFISMSKGSDIDNERFRELINFVRANIPDDARYTTELSPVMWTQFYDVYYDFVSGLSGYQSWDVYGAPSFDGRGPMVTNFDTAVMTKCAADKDISWSFIKCLLSKDVQINHKEANPINIEAFDQYAAVALEQANEARLAQNSSARVLDQSDIDRYKSMLIKADSPSYYDVQIVMIIDEELQPYFGGDKSIDDVIRIMENRIKLVLDERE